VLLVIPIDLGMHYPNTQQGITKHANPQNKASKMRISIKKPFFALLAGVALAGCAANNSKPAVEIAPQSVSSTQQQGVHHYQLDNGLKIFVKEDHRAPVAISQLWYKVGASYEYGGITGVSHVLEHMMFKGTKDYGPNEFSKIIAANGGRENAFTGRDYTAYFQTLEASRLEVAFKMESNRMRNLRLNEEEFQKEVKVVMEERRMRTEDKPTALTYEQFNATAYVNSPYQNPVIGWMDDLENMELNDLQQWYQSWYAPNNAVLVVVGDVDPQHIYQLAKKYYGPIKPSETATPKPRNEIKPLGEKQITVKAPAELPYFIMGYQVPVVRTAEISWEPYALDMLASVLDGSKSARFSKELVRNQQIAANAGAGYSLFSRHNEQFLFDGTPANGHSIEALQAAILEQIERVKTELVSEDELERIKAKVITSKVYELDSIFYQAMKIGLLETVGLDYRLQDDYLDNIKAVTPEQIREVANKYLIEDRRTTAVLKPQPLDNHSAAVTTGDRNAY